MAEKNNKPGSSSNQPSPRSEISASPPSFISFEEFMKASNSVANMALAHEIAIDEDFKLTKFEPDNSQLNKLKQTMMTAFWDVLRSQLNADPPQFDQALNLLTELREDIKGLLLPTQTTIRNQIDEQLDIELIKQQLERNAFDLRTYSTFIITTMGRLCAPIRDEDIEKLKTIDDPVELYKEIFRVLDLMKMDMANFTISQMRPYIQQHSVMYEKKKFQEFLETKNKINIDGLAITKEWLNKSYQKMKSENSDPITPSILLCNAYLDLLDWNQDKVFPETCAMDDGRILTISQSIKQLVLVSTMIVIVFTFYRAPSNPIEFKETIKSHCLAVISGVNSKSFEEKAENLAICIESDVKSNAQQANVTIGDAKLNELKTNIIQAVNTQNPIHKLLTTRLNEFILKSLVSNHNEPLQIPQGLSTVQIELQNFIGRLMRIVAHNRNVFGEYYDDIIHKILPVKPSTTTTTTSSQAPV